MVEEALQQFAGFGNLVGLGEDVDATLNGLLNRQGFPGSNELLLQPHAAHAEPQA